MQSVYAKTKQFYVEKYTFNSPMSDMHFHHAYEFYYLIKGARDYFIGDRFFKLKAGDIAIIPTDVLHRTVGKGATRILLYFTDDFFSRFFSREICDKILPELTGGVLRPPESEREKIMNAFQTILHDYETNPKNPDEAMLALRLLELTRILINCSNTFSSKIIADSRIDQVVRYVNENFRTIKSVEEVSNQFFISKYYFCKLFRDNVGVSLFTYLNTVKIQHACTLIKNGKKNMTDVASECGFNNSAYLCKVFKSVMGISPSEYKKMVSVQKN